MNLFRASVFLLLATAAGCASFEPLRENQFVDENRRFLLVEYGKGEVRETEFVTPTGVRLPFKSALKVRVTLPDGEQFIAYQNMSVVGNLYFTEDRHWEYPFVLILSNFTSHAFPSSSILPTTARLCGEA